MKWMPRARPLAGRLRPTERLRASEGSGEAWGVEDKIRVARESFATDETVASVATLEAIAGGHPASDIDQLLPWAFTPISR